MHETLAEVAPALDPERPRYLMGVGTPRDLVRAIGAGVDMFDCVLPTRNARNGRRSRASGAIVIKQRALRATTAAPSTTAARARAAPAAIRAPTCATSTWPARSSCLRLLSLHNLHLYGELVAGAREAIPGRAYAAWAQAGCSPPWKARH